MSDISIFDCVFSCYKPGYERAAYTFANHLMNLDTEETRVFIGYKKFTVKSKLAIGDQYIIIEKVFEEGVAIAEYSEFLLNWKADYYDARIVEYHGDECCEKIRGFLDEGMADGPPWGITLFSDVLMGAPGTVYGWYTGNHWRTNDKLKTWEQVLGVLDLIPGEVLVKMGIVGLVTSSGVVVVKYAGKGATIGFKVLKHVPSHLPNRIIKTIPDKTVTLIGNYNNDMQKVLGELDYSKTLDFGAKKGNFNLLNVPDELYNPSTFWGKFNKPWIEQATQRGDDIIALSNPKDNALLYYNGYLTGFGNEIKFMENLVKEGKYKFASQTGTYIAIK